jgi:hypothetical protein
VLCSCLHVQYCTCTLRACTHIATGCVRHTRMRVPAEGKTALDLRFRAPSGFGSRGTAYRISHHPPSQPRTPARTAMFWCARIRVAPFHHGRASRALTRRGPGGAPFSYNPSLRRSCSPPRLHLRPLPFPAVVCLSFTHSRSFSSAGDIDISLTSTHSPVLSF